jgi:molybdopterin molybdotransferase
MMDGIAVKFSDLENGIISYKITCIQQAGKPAENLIESSTCIEVMTGAICPNGADAVIPYEQVSIEDGIATISIDTIKPWMNVHLQGTDAIEGSELLVSNSQIGIAEIGIAASLGLSKIEVIRLPRVAIVSTGDELVEISEKPLPYQIRRSNAHALKAMLQTAGGDASLHHIADNPAELTFRLHEIMQSNDVLLLSGGVSKGKFDFVPQVLQQLQVIPVFHRIAQKPGKPMWFGASAKHLVFAFPGNPVSTLLCASRYFMPWWKSQFQALSNPHLVMCQSEFHKKGKLAMFLPCQLQLDTSGIMNAYVLPNNGSGDFASLAGAQGFIEVPADHDVVKPGTLLQYWPLNF